MKIVVLCLTTVGAMVVGCIDADTQSPSETQMCREEKLVCRCNVNTTDGSVYKLVAPNGGEVFSVGDTIRVKYCCEEREDSATTADWIREAILEISLNGGKSWFNIAGEQVTALRDERYWVIPPTMVTIDENGDMDSLDPRSAECLMRVVPYQEFGGSDQGDTSDSLFVIR